MFKAYFDDSSSDEGSRTLLLAGCVQRYSAWADFSLSWEAELARSPRIHHLHMREARNLTGEFTGWKARARDDKIRQLARVVESYDPWIITAWISRREHDAILKSIAPYLLNQPYFSVFYSVILKLAHWHHAMGLTLPVDYVFDEQGSVGSDAALWYEYIKSIQKPEIAAIMGSSPKFENDELVLPLQAADMAAWHIRRHKDRPNEDERSWPTAPLVDLLRGEVHVTKEALTTMAEQMSQVPHVELVQTKGKKNRTLRTIVEQSLRAKFPGRSGTK